MKRVKGKRSPWLTSELKREMNFRDSLHRICKRTRSETDFDNYKRQRNKTNDLVRKAKDNHHKTILRESANNSQKFWQAIKDIFPSKEKISCAKYFLIDGVTYSEPSAITSRFCSFFSVIARKLKAKSIFLKYFIWAHPYRNRNKTDTKFQFRPVTVNEAFKHLKSLQKNKATGIDDLSPRFLKDTAVNIAKPLSYVINLCLKYGTVPVDLKIGKVTPVYKSGSKHEMNNYRPITVLPNMFQISRTLYPFAARGPSWGTYAAVETSIWISSKKEYWGSHHHFSRLYQKKYGRR